MTSRIVIVGGGGFGRGVWQWISSSPRHRAEHDIAEVVFVDDGRPRVPTELLIGTASGYEPREGDRVLCAVGAPKLRRQLVGTLEARGTVFHSFVDDRAVVAGGIVVGTGSIVCPGSVVSAGARISEHVHINFNCSIGHDAYLDSYVTLSPSVNVMGEVQVEQGAFLGGSAVVLPRTRIGEWSTIGAGAVVVRGSEKEAVMVGNPARDVNDRSNER